MDLATALTLVTLVSNGNVLCTYDNVVAVEIMRNGHVYLYLETDSTTCDPEIIFSDDFETGHTSKWDSRTRR